MLINESLFTPTKADAMMAALNESDPDWTYVSVHDPKGTGYSFVAIYDEDGEYVGTL